MMRRYMVGSLETDDVGLKSSQSLRNSEQTSSQMENSQCSSFDLFSQMMSQQQGYNSQPSEASQVAQKYYTKFTSKPSLFRNTGGKEVTALSDKPGLTRQRSFQDLQEFQKQKIRDKEERDLICTLISLLKESTDEIKSVVEKMQTDVQTQISSASVKTEEALRKTSQCFQDYTKDIFQEVINKLTVYQTTSQMEIKLQEKEAVVETLRSELENARATRYDEIKQILQKTSSEYHKANIEEVNKILDDSCNSWKLDQQHFLDEFCNTAATKLEEKLKDGFRKVAQEWNKDLVQIAQVAGASTSESQNISVSRGQVSPYHSSRGHAGSRRSNSKPHQYLPPAIPIPHHNAPLTAVHGTAASNQASLKPTMPSVPSRDGRVLQSTLNLMTQEVYVNGQTRSKCHFTSNQNHNALPEQRTEFGSPSLSQQSVTQPTLRTPFARWGSKGPSPVATVAPLVKETIQQVIPRGGQSSVAPSKQDIRRKGKRNNYLPPQRRSARLKERKVGGKQYPAAACYSQERKSQTQKRDAYSHGYMTKMKRKSQSQLDFEMARSSQRRAVQKDFYGLNNDEQVIQVPRRPTEMTGYVHFGENHNTSCHEPVFGAPVVTYNRSGKRSGNQMKEVFQTVPQFVSNYGSDSDNSSTEGTFLSAQHQGVSSSQDLFIDAIEDQQINTSDEEEEEFSPCFLRNVKDNHCTDARVTNEVTRAVKKKRTLWGPATPQKRDLITFLTGAIGRKRHVV